MVVDGNSRFIKFRDEILANAAIVVSFVKVAVQKTFVDSHDGHATGTTSS